MPPVYRPFYRPYFNLNYHTHKWFGTQASGNARLMCNPVCAAVPLSQVRVGFKALETADSQELLAQQPTTPPFCGEVLFSVTRLDDLAGINPQRGTRRYNLVDGNIIISILVIAACMAHRLTASHAGR